VRFPLAFALAAISLSPPELSPATLRAYDHYVAVTEKRIDAERSGTTPLFWIDRQNERTRTAAWAKLRRGEIIAEPVETRDNGQSISVPSGRVHHWVATALLTGVTVDRVLAVVRDYDRYPQVFAPLMTRARAIERSVLNRPPDAQDRDVVALRTSIKKLVNVIMDGDYVMQYFRLAPTRVATTTVATNLHQVINEGRPDERREPTDRTAGYLWRYRMYCTIEQRPEGILDQCESLTLTRPVPGLVSWLIGGTVAAIPRDSLTLMLSGTRTALRK
jgi:hypothetical protein